MSYRIPFAKYAGCGNDFIIFDGRKSPLPPFPIPSLCNRHRGIGADGVIIIENSLQAHAKMRIFNADGSEAEMCGNGIRCLIHSLFSKGGCPPACLIETAQGVLKGKIENASISIEMGNPQDVLWDIPFEIEKRTYRMHSLNTGVPHAVFFVEHLSQINLKSFGPYVRFHSFWQPKGTNVSFAEKRGDGQFAIRTYERGVESETLACGTGATAVALAASYEFNLQAPLSIMTESGESLQIDFKGKGGQFSEVVMKGPVQFIYNGEIEIT
ncbi:MAG: diaminopimelate epimerase [Parachlamydia sp.]|jgi:diaminopimelate epimerase|nr:diaminopimelate epimerase [Parachlamydia sp.]